MINSLIKANGSNKLSKLYRIVSVNLHLITKKQQIKFNLDPIVTQAKKQIPKSVKQNLNFLQKTTKTMSSLQKETEILEKMLKTKTTKI